MKKDFRSGPISELVDINPPVSVNGLKPDAAVSFIPMADVSDGGLWTTRQTRMLKEVRSGYTPFSEGDVLFAKITPCMENGKGCHVVGLENGVGFGSTEFYVLRAKSSASARFVFHWTQSEMLRLQAEARMIGSAGQQRVPADFFEQFKILLFDPDEQRRIAEVLDAVDAAVQCTDRLINKLKSIKLGLVNDLLTRGLNRDGKLRDPVGHPEQFQDKPPFGLIPHDWDVTELAGIVPRAEYGISSSLDNRNGIPVLRMNNLNDGEVEPFDLKFSTSVAATKLLLRPLDVLFNRTNSIDHVGRTGIWRGQLEQVSFASYLVRLVPDETRILPEYLNAWLNLLSTQLLLKRYATPSVQQANINPTNLRKVWLSLPKDIEEQKAIVRNINSHDLTIKAEKANREKLVQIRKGFMHDLLTGRVRVPPIDPEVVAV